MKIDRNGAKFISRVLMSETKPSVMLITFLYIVMSTGLYFLVLKLSGYYDYMVEFLIYFQATGKYYTGALPEIGTIEAVLCIALVILKVIFDSGYEMYILLISRRIKTEFRTLFYGFNFPVKTFLIAVIKNCLVLLGLSLFIVPGVVLYYWYRFAFFVLVDHPEYSAIRCLRESRKLVKGNTAQLFVLDLSLLGWRLLSWTVSMTMLPVLDIWVKPYTGAVFAVYYNLFTFKSVGIKIVSEDGKGIVHIVADENMQDSGENQSGTGSGEIGPDDNDGETKPDADSGEADKKDHNK